MAQRRSSCCRRRTACSTGPAAAWPAATSTSPSRSPSKTCSGRRKRTSRIALPPEGDNQHHRRRDQEMTIKRIMVVDDSPTDRSFVEGLLKKRGYEVLLIATGEAAIERSKTEQPDLILMDVVMPGLNGSQAPRAITREEKTRHIPIIICTTKDEDTDRIWGLRQGAKDYIVKPLSESDLFERIGPLIRDQSSRAAIH